MEHIQALIPDYVLGLLDPQTRRAVEAHTLTCAVCSRALARERQLARVIGDTIHDLTRPEPARLRALRPALPMHREPRGRVLLAGLTPVVAVVVMLVAGLMSYSGQPLPFATPLLPGGAVVTNTPTSTATQTHTPTATLAALPPGDTGSFASYAVPGRTQATSAIPSMSIPAEHVSEPAVVITPEPQFGN